jgi:hypothetical protein
MSMDYYLVLQTLQFDDHFACNSAPSEGFTMLREDKLDCLNLSCFCLNCFKLPDSIHDHEFLAFWPRNIWLDVLVCLTPPPKHVLLVFGFTSRGLVQSKHATLSRAS